MSQQSSRPAKRFNWGTISNNQNSPISGSTTQLARVDQRRLREDCSHIGLNVLPWAFDFDSLDLVARGLET